MKALSDRALQRVANFQGIVPKPKQAQGEEDTYKSYWDSVKGAAQEIKDEVKEYGGEVDELLSQNVDSSYWVIYYHANMKALEYSNNEDYIEEVGVDLDTSKGWRNILTQVAYWAFYADVSEALESIGYDGEGFGDEGEDAELTEDMRVE